MNILSLTAGAASMYCGSCLRDNALARELLRMGHQVTLMPVYTPTKTDIENQSSTRKVLFGGISVYLQQKSALFRHTPWLVDRLWDSRFALKAAAKRSLAVDPKFLGAMTVSMLEGESGAIAKEFLKLQAWLMDQPRPDVIQIPNALVISMASALRRIYDGPLVCTLQGEDLFLDGLQEPYRSRSMHLIRQQLDAIDAFVSVSTFYAGYMAEYLGIPRHKIHIVPLGVDGRDFPVAPRRAEPFTVGYLARIAPEKGLHLLAEAWREFRKLHTGPARLRAAGYLAPEHHDYLAQARTTAPELEYAGELDLAGKKEYLAGLDVFCVPPVYEDPKGLYVLEAMAAGVPVVAPRRGALPEHIERARGGVVVERDNPRALAGALYQMLSARPETTGREQVLRHYTLAAMAERTVEVYQTLLTAGASR